MIIRVTDSTHAGEARRHAALLAEDAKLGERESGSVAIAVTEMVTNCPVVRSHPAARSWRNY